MNIGAVKVHFIYYDTRAELATMLRRIDAAPDIDPREADSTIVLAIPGKLRAFLGWAKKGTPRPEVHGDAIVFRHHG